jgi:hypothetical protein
MKTLIPLINISEELVDNISHQADGFDPELLWKCFL